MDIVTDQQRKKLHPHKFTLWVAIASILMMFAGLTSAFIVKSNQANWQGVEEMPKFFWYSTVAILLSSLAIQMALRAFRQREMGKYRSLIATTLVLGVLFIVFQWLGFGELWDQQITFKGAGGGQFLYVIFGLHALHVLGGIGKTKTYSSVPVEVAATYWHFVDGLWIYLLVFFLIIG
jgi:cytochrome c oxidase subunit 3